MNNHLQEGTMNEDMPTEVAGVVGWVEGANLSPGARDSLRVYLHQLSQLVREFGQTYESRYRGKILGLEQAMLGQLTQEKEPGLAEALAGGLRDLHDRIGLPGLDPLPAARPLPTRKRKTG